MELGRFDRGEGPQAGGGIVLKRGQIWKVAHVVLDEPVAIAHNGHELTAIQMGEIEYIISRC